MDLPGYELLEELGRGGMGVVYRARQVRLKRIVALKRIVSGDAASSEQRARFQREAEAFARLDHPNIVRIFELGEHEGQPFFSMEYVEGGSLKQRLEAGQPSFREVAQLLEVLARAIHHAHEQHVIHRDLKPANVLLKKDGTPRISDFGLARCLDEQDHLTNSGAILGSVNYLSPEQALGQSRHVGPAADVHALGTMLYEMLTGQLPFPGNSVLEILARIGYAEPMPPTRLEPAVPRPLEAICLRCLQKDPARRYATGRELADELRAFLNAEPAPVVPPPVRPEQQGRAEWWRQ